jgi:hypothetical protein
MSETNDIQQAASSGLPGMTCSPSSDSEFVIVRGKDGILSILRAPEVFLCTRESVGDLIDRHNQILTERDTALAALRNLADAVGAMKVPQTVEDDALQIHVTLGPALAAARKILPENSGAMARGLAAQDSEPTNQL